MKIRIKFAKYGAVKFIGHLDVMRFFQKAIRRAEIDIAYSEGFSPHQIMSFAAPLSVGNTSEGEYMDIEVNSLSSEADLKSKLQAVCVEGIDILDVQILSPEAGNAMASVAAASYMISFRAEDTLPVDWTKQLLLFYEQPVISVIKPTKKGEKEINLKESIYDLKVQKNYTGIEGQTYQNSVYLMLNATSGGNIKPSFVMDEFFKTLSYEMKPFSMLVHRIDTYQNIGTEQERNFKGLIWEK